MVYNVFSLGVYRILMLGNWMIMIQLVTVHWNTLSRNPDIDKVVDETELMEIWNNGLGKAKGTIQWDVMDNLCNNLPVYGIYLDDNFLVDTNVARISLITSLRNNQWHIPPGIR